MRTAGLFLRPALYKLLSFFKVTLSFFNPINPLVDLYNSVSLSYALPCGGEDLAALAGDLRLGMAQGGSPSDLWERKKMLQPFQVRSSTLMIKELFVVV